MIALLLILTWVAQGIPLPQAQTGTITGTLKTELGKPAVGVRVGAMIRPDAEMESSSASALATIAETDASGHFRLENIPQGRYYITAGRVDFPTYFPGTQLMSAGTTLLVKAGETIAGVDFVMNSQAVRPPDTGFAGLPISVVPTLILPVTVRIAGGDAVPVYSAKGIANLQLTRTSDGSVQVIPLASTIAVPVPTIAAAPPEFRVAFQNLPEGYAVESMALGSAPVTNATVKIGAGGAAPGSALSALIITLRAPQSPVANTGARVSGRAPTSELRSVYLNGVPGIFFADGSFEFRGVIPGRYNVSTPDNPVSSRPLGAAVVVGTQDVAGIELMPTPMLPLNIKTPLPAEPAGNRTPGSIPLAAVRGAVLDDATHEPITAGTVYLTGHYGGSASLVPDGRFEFSKLLPGSYQMEVQAFGHNTIRKVIVVGEDDVDLKLDAVSTEDRMNP